MKILLISDIHGNYPALEAVDLQAKAEHFDLIINGGDSVVYATFPNETLDWLREKKAISILGNTDIKVLKLLQGKSFKKPRKAEKRIMYTWTADQLTGKNKRYLTTFGHYKDLELENYRVCLYHGSPENPDEHLFQDTPATRYQELAEKTSCNIIITGHSHSPYHKKIDNVHFINPGSVGRMFDSNPEASYAILELGKKGVKVQHFRCPYDVVAATEGIKDNLLPQIYAKMFRQGRKLN
jgi:putative phosphoesterase